MCTAIAFQANGCYFGRNLDLDYSYEESITITPRHFPLHFRLTDPLLQHYAIVGVAYVQNGYPLYYDAANETGLAIAGLRFPDSTVYHAPDNSKINIAPFELIPWLLGQCASVTDAQELLQKSNIAKLNFSEELPCTPLHWMITDRTRSIVLESCADGLHLYDNPIGILTNEPPFPLQRKAAEAASTHISGGYSSSERFQRASALKRTAEKTLNALSAVNLLFHLFQSVAVPCLDLVDNHPKMITQYTSCCDLDRKIYYYTTYENSTIHAVDLHREDLNNRHLISYPLLKKGQIHLQNL